MIPKLNMRKLKRSGKADRTSRTLKGKCIVELHQRAVDTSNISKSESTFLIPPGARIKLKTTKYTNIAFCPKDK